MNPAVHIVSTAIIPNGAIALAAIKAAGYKLDWSTGSYRLRRFDNSQVNVYRVNGVNSISGCIANVSDITLSDAAVVGLNIMRADILDQQTRLALPQWTPPPIARYPYG